MTAARPSRAKASRVVRWSVNAGRSGDLTDTMALTRADWSLISKAIGEKREVYVDGHAFRTVLQTSDFTTLTTEAAKAEVVREVIGRSVGNVDLLHCVRQAYGLEPS